MLAPRKLLSLTLAGVLCVNAPSTLAGSCLVDPVALSPNLITSVFGKTRDLPHYGGTPRVHWGVDFQARNGSDRSKGADLLAADSGTVVGAGFWGSGYGNRVAIKRDNGDLVIYSHLAKIEPRLKSGAAIGFKDTDGGAKVGTEKVTSGEKIGVAGGTANEMGVNSMAIHLHLEYVTGYGGTQLRETNDGTNSTRSKYMRNAEDYMCRNIAHAPGAGNASPPPGGSPAATGGAGGPQADTAARAQPKVEPGERYGIPDAPPYDSYAGMSESQIVEAEMLRRALDTEWEEKLTEWSKRGLWMEISRIDGVMLWLDQRIAEKKSRVEGMMAVLLAQKTNRFFAPRLNAMRDRAERISVARKVN